MKILICTLLAVMCATAATAAENSKKVKLSAVPAAVRQAIRAQFPKGRLDELARTVDDGRVIYEVNITKDGVERYFSVSEEGKLLSWQVLLNETPAAVQKIIREQLGSDQLGQINRTDEHGDFIYEVEIKHGEATRSLTVSALGKLLSLQVELSKAPSEVQAVIKRHLGDQKLGKITRNESEEEVVYEVEMTKGAKEITFSVSTGGFLVSEQIELAEAPGEVQRAVREKLGSGKLLWLDRAFDEGETSYNIGTRMGAVERSFGFNNSGEVISEAVFLSETPELVRKAIEGKTTDAVLVQIEKATDEGETFFEVELRKGGKKEHFKLNSEGRVVED